MHHINIKKYIFYELKMYSEKERKKEGEEKEEKERRKRFCLKQNN